MKNSITFLVILISFLFISCNTQEQGEINLVLKIPTNNIDGETQEAQKKSSYVPIDLLKYLKSNAQVNLGILSPGRGIKNIPIIAMGKELDEKTNLLTIDFAASLEKGNNTALVFGIGDKNYEKTQENNDDEIVDAKLNQMFVNGGLFDIKNDGLFYAGADIKMEELTLLPLLHFSSNILEKDNGKLEPITDNAKIKAYPSILNANGQYTNKILETESDGSNLELSNVYGVFDEASYFPPNNLANMIITAVQGNKFGFTLASKEYYDLTVKDLTWDNQTQVQGQVGAEYLCYKYYEEGQTMCGDTMNPIQLECFFDKTLIMEDKERFQTCTSTQSGNLLPGVNLKNNIVIYSDEEINSNEILVSSVSAPKFKKTGLDLTEGNPDAINPYYGNFFITGFNFDKIEFSKENGDTKSGVIRVYYALPDSLQEKGYNKLYIEYKGPFVLYELPNIKKEDDDNPEGKEIPAFANINLYVLQNRLPFYQIYAEDSQGMKHFVDLEFLRANLSELERNKLELKNTIDIGAQEEYFLGVQSLEKILTDLDVKVSEIKFSPKLYTLNEKFELYSTTIYTTADTTEE